MQGGRGADDAARFQWGCENDGPRDWVDSHLRDDPGAGRPARAEDSRRKATFRARSDEIGQTTQLWPPHPKLDGTKWNVDDPPPPHCTNLEGGRGQGKHALPALIWKRWKSRTIPKIMGTYPLCSRMIRLDTDYLHAAQLHFMPSQSETCRLNWLKLVMVLKLLGKLFQSLAALYLNDLIPLVAVLT